MCVWTIQHGHSAICYHFQGKRPDAGNYFGCPNYFFVFFDVYVSTWNFALLSSLKFRILLFRVCMCVSGFFFIRGPLFLCEWLFLKCHFHFSTNFSSTDNSHNFLLHKAHKNVTRFFFPFFVFINKQRERSSGKKHSHTHSESGQLRVFNCNQPLFFTKS